MGLESSGPFYRAGAGAERRSPARTERPEVRGKEPRVEAASFVAPRNSLPLATHLIRA